MFGYVRPSDGHLTAEDKQRFQAAYCGLCRSLGRRYGLAARMILNYDLAFLAMLLSREPECPTAHCRCPAHPIRGCDALERQDAFDAAADLSVILTWWQLTDGVADHGFFRGLPYRAALLALSRAYRKARARRPGFDERTRAYLEELARLEEEIKVLRLPRDPNDDRNVILEVRAGIGGEDKADVSPEVRDGIVGPGMAFKAAFNGEAEIVATFICGDNYCANHLDDVAAHMVETVKAYGADGLIAGPAFNAGRYGTACGAVCAAVAKELHLPVVSGMYRESPGVDLYRKEVTIVETADSARGMGKAVPAMAAVMLKLLKGEEIADPEAAGVFPKGIRKNMFYEQPGAERAVQMLIKKLNGEAFRTEYPMPVFDRVEPRPAIADISKATIAIVTSGGIVPFGNPDHIAASSAQNYGAYDLDGVTDLRKGEYMTAHGGYDQTYANADPDRVLPIDVLRDLEKEGKIGKLYHVFYSTVGNGTSVANARKFGTEIGSQLKAAHVDGVILTST